MKPKKLKAFIYEDKFNKSLSWKSSGLFHYIDKNNLDINWSYIHNFSGKALCWRKSRLNKTQ